jgi:hypothetical protein
MRVLISFCNHPAGVEGNLLLLDMKTGKKQGLLDLAVGFTGLTQDEEYIYAMCQDEKIGLHIFRKQDLKLVSVLKMENVSAPHSLAVRGEEIFAVSTGTDRVQKYSINKKDLKIIFEKNIWVPDGSNGVGDTHHINSVCVDGNSVLVSAFNRKENEKWSSARRGYVYDINEKKIILENIYHPHSAIIRDKEVYCCESTTSSVKKGKETIINLEKGYTRGLDIAGKYLFLGTSSGRKNSLSTGLTNNPADPGSLIEECSLYIFRKFWNSDRYWKIKRYSFLPKHKEIYDIMVLR